MTRLATILLLLASTALAHEEGEHAEWYRSLTQPGTGASCCHNRDCRITDDWREVGPGFEVRIAGRWIAVPADKVLSERPNPTGHAVVCAIGESVLCFLPIAEGA